MSKRHVSEKKETWRICQPTTRREVFGFIGRSGAFAGRADIGKTRRAALGALAAAAGLAIPAIGSIAAPLADPIFVAIARHKAAYDAALASSFALDDLIDNPQGRGVTDADWEVYERARADEDATFDELLACAPRTSAGMRAIIAHLIYLDDGRLSDKMRRLLTLLLPPEASAG